MATVIPQYDDDTQIFANLTEDIYLAIAKGNVKGHSFIQKFGHNESLGTSGEDIWDGSGLYVYLDNASILKISSDDANDTSAGTGARTVEIFGLDSKYNDISETIILNGQTAVNTTKSYLRIFRMIVRTAGSGESNAGIIYAGTGAVTAGVPANIFAEVTAGHNQTLMALYTIPAGKTGYICCWQFSTASQKATDAALFVRPFEEVFQVKTEMHFFQDTLTVNYAVPLKVEEKSDITIRGSVDAGTTLSGGNFALILVDNV